MEQKRTIWIVLAAGIFLSAVLGTATILYASEARKNTTALYQRDNGSVWMSPEAAQHKSNEVASQKNDLYAQDFASSPSVIEKNGYSEGNEKIAYLDIDTLDGKSDINLPEAEKLNTMPESSSSEVSVIYGKNDIQSTTIDLNAVRETPAIASNVTAQNRTAETAVRETNNVRKNIEKNEPLVEKTAKTSPVISPTPVAAPAPEKKISDRFWVQAGSFTTTKNADEARGILESNKIPCEVFTSEVKDVLYYRVRVGPYTTKSEAEYWKQRIDAIPQFAKNGSYVTSTSSVK